MITQVLVYVIDIGNHYPIPRSEATYSPWEVFESLRNELYQVRLTVSKIGELF